MAARDDKAAAFTQSAAQRIVRAVRLVERGGRDMHAKPLRTAWDEGGTSVRLGTFEGAWPVGDYKMVSLRHGGGDEEVEVLNLFCAAGDACGPTRWCAVFEDGGLWYLLAAECGAHQ